MPYPGKIPKPEGERVRRNAPAYERVPIKWDGKLRGPTLPKEFTWCKQTKKWWAEFRRSPQSMVCVESDWSFLMDTALVHNRIWSDPTKLSPTELRSLSAEFRTRMASYGSTWDDRLKLGIKLESPQTQNAKGDTVKAGTKEAIDYAAIVKEDTSK